MNCPGCGGPGAVPVPEAVGRKDLRRRLSKAPLLGRVALLHAVEGLVLVALTLGWAAMGADQGKPLYVVGALALTAVIAVVTCVVVRDDLRGRGAVRAGAARAESIWLPARYCVGCDAVFCPEGAPWQGPVTPERFTRLVWTQGGYGDRLPPEGAGGA
ncbi:hypothetical protein [Streptomyces sp. NRRL B-1347]|uniref:hypothetical protein n=1 Tax=Streptomyces sp. NRRL B-1347 TaxID=1476877 RepID=UPI0006921109|nr:hypothetical protein [Streptomyces sp. NRRL B-1347]